MDLCEKIQSKSEPVALAVGLAESAVQTPKQEPAATTLGTDGIQQKIALLIQERIRLPKGEHKRRKAIDDRLYQLRHREQYLSHLKNYYEKHPEKWTESRKRRTPEQIALANKTTAEWIKKHPERRKKTSNGYYARHRDDILMRCRTPERKAKTAAHLRLRRKSDPDFRLRCTLRSRIKAALKSQAGKGEASAVALIGCSIAALKAHLQSQFTGTMRWGEARRSWHIDHYVPLSAFNLHDTEELHWACNWRNLRPLTGKDNREKHCLIPDLLPDWLPAHIAERIKSRKNYLPL